MCLCPDIIFGLAQPFILITRLVPGMMAVHRHESKCYTHTHTKKNGGKKSVAVFKVSITVKTRVVFSLQFTGMQHIIVVHIGALVVVVLTPG